MLRFGLGSVGRAARWMRASSQISRPSSSAMWATSDRLWSSSVHAVPRRSLCSEDQASLEKMRNIGISAHIDSGKTTVTERILYYCGRIKEIHDVKGKDGVGATMDHMDLEREKGITIQSAATFTTWKDHNFNIIDTPGHVDFTIEVERALRVLDGAILVMCGVSGVQSQTITVHRQMARNNVPFITFVNKLDRQGADPYRAVDGLRDMLGQPCHHVQIPIGLEEHHSGVVDLISQRAYRFDGDRGEIVTEIDVPEDLVDEVEEQRTNMLEYISDLDDELAEKYMEDEFEEQDVKDAIRRLVLAREFTPVFMGSAFKNKGVQPVLDGVIDYLPNPTEVENKAFEQKGGEEHEVVVDCDPKQPLVGLAFKLEEGRFGQLTYMRVYRGEIKKAQSIYNNSTQKMNRVPRLVRMHSNDMEEIQNIKAGDIAALFGVSCASGDTFTGSKTEHMTMSSMFVPDPVISLSIKPKSADMLTNFSKGIDKFVREDPTFRVHTDEETKDLLISGMGELHLDVYLERLKREYNVECEVGRPKVHYRETPTRKVAFDYLHKKQSGGQGQYARLFGYIEPITEEEVAAKGGDSEEANDVFEFVNAMTGNDVPPEYHRGIEKGFEEIRAKGVVSGHRVIKTRVVVEGGASHAVDSSELAFKLCAAGAFRSAFQNSNPIILEPVMNAQVEIPMEFQTDVVGDLARKGAQVETVEPRGQYCVLHSSVPLQRMFGFSTQLRSLTQGKGEFAMEYKAHEPCMPDDQQKIIDAYLDEIAARNASK